MLPKYFLAIFSVLVFSVSVIYYFTGISRSSLSGSRYFQNAEDLDSLHSENISDSNSDDRIYFLETSGYSQINYRQSCAVESAARQNRNRPVILYICSPETNTSSRPLELLTEYKNIRIESLNITDYFQNTPLEDWYSKGLWKNSPYSVVHLSDYLRILSVYKHGGQYLDLDFIVTQSMDPLRNYVVYESKDYFSNAAFHFNKGNAIVSKMIDHLARNYNPDSWAGHGPTMMSNVIISNCNRTESSAFGAECGTGISLLEPKLFFPVHYSQWRRFFENNTSYELPEDFSEAYAIHLWNKLSSKEPVIVGSSQYYAILAAKYCPLSFAGAPSRF